jgi:plastocyanin
MNAYVVAGLILAAWAVIVALLGMRGFPSNRGGERLAIAVTAVLFVGAVGSAIADQTKVGERKGPEVEEPTADEANAKVEERPSEQGGKAPAPATKEPAPAEKGGGGEAATLALTADPTGQLKYDKNTLSAGAGKVTITMTNPSPVPHNVSLRGSGVNEEGDTVQGDGKSTVEADLKPGSYEFYCSVPGHEQGGMKGTLTVK